MLPEPKENPDGGLTLYPERESKWLPAPDGPV
jgi:hypothetical protein